MGSRLRSSTRASTAASDFLADQADTKVKSETRTRSTAAPRPPKASEVARLLKIAVFAFFLSITIIGGVIYFIHNDTLRLYPKNYDAKSLPGSNSRFEYCIRYQTLLFLWLVFNVNSVIYARLTKKALNPLVDSTEKHAQMQKNILTNSFEQIILSAFLQLAFASFADSETVLKYIPAVNVVQFVGRIAFFFGYPMYRTLGISLTMLPNLMMLCFNVYRFGIFLGFY